MEQIIPFCYSKSTRTRSPWKDPHHEHLLQLGRARHRSPGAPDGRGGHPRRRLTLPTPCADWNVTQVLQHAAGDQLAYAFAITGKDGPADNPFAPSGHLEEDPIAYAERATRATAEAWKSVGADVQDAPTPLPLGPLPAWVGAGAAAIDAAVHAWDIAVATGQPSPLTPELARTLMKAAVEVTEPLRAFAYAPALDAQEGDDDVATLLRYLGRDPHWTAA